MECGWSDLWFTLKFAWKGTKQGTCYKAGWFVYPSYRLIMLLDAVLFVFFFFNKASLWEGAAVWISSRHLPFLDPLTQSRLAATYVSHPETVPRIFCSSFCITKVWNLLSCPQNCRMEVLKPCSVELEWLSNVFPKFWFQFETWQKC